MKNTIYIFVLCCLCVMQALAQSAQPCVVSEYRGKEAKSPLEGVSITAANAGTVMSDAQGTLTLQFRTLKVGDPIQFRRIDKAGYEVMNPEVLEAARVMRSRPAADATGTGVTTLHSTLSSLHITMAPSKLLRQLRDGYRSVASQRYQKQLEEAEAEAERLKEAGKLAEAEYNERMDALEAEYEEKLSNLESYIDKFARIDLSDLDQDEQQIIDLVQAGDFDQALALYDKQDLGTRLVQSRADRQKLADAREQIAEAERQKEQENLRLRQSIERQVTLLRMAGGEENLRKAHEVLYQTFLADTTYVEARLDYAKSLSDFNELDEAIRVVNCGLASVQDPADEAKMLAYLTDDLWTKEEFEQAYQMALRADSLMTPLLESNHVLRTRTYPGVANTQLLYHLTMGDMEQSGKVVERARQLWEPDSLLGSSLSNYAMLLTNVSNYYSRQADHQQTLWATDEGIAIGEALHRRYTFASTLDQTMANAASTYVLEGRPEDARRATRRSLELIDESLGKGMLISRYIGVCIDYYLLTDAMLFLKDYAMLDSIVQQEQKWHVMQQIDERMPGVLDAYIGLFDLSNVYLMLERQQVAEAETLAQSLFDRLSQNPDGEVALPYLRPSTLASIHRAKGEYAEAEQLYLEAIAVCEASYAETQDAWSTDNICRYLALLADMKGEEGDMKAMRRYLKQLRKVALFEGNRQQADNIEKKYKK